MYGPTAECDGIPLTLSEFLDTVTYSDPKILAHWAGKWFEPPKAQIGTPEQTASDEEAERLVTLNAPKLLRLFLEGPKSGDRSQGLVGLARGLYKRRTLTQEQLWSIVASADRRWCKYYLRPNWEDYISDVTARAIDSC